jgi:uncharacterized protein
MYPEYLLGNIQQTELAQLANSEQQLAFGAAKSQTLPPYCLRCEFLFACHGECPKNRFASTAGGEPGLNYLCPSYKNYFRHIAKYMNAMAKLISHNQPASLVMDALNGPLLVKLPAKLTV